MSGDSVKREIELQEEAHEVVKSSPSKQKQQLGKSSSADDVAPPQAKRKRQSSKTGGKGGGSFAKDAFKSLNDFRKKSFLCDFAIITGRTAHKVHRSVLAARSPYFRDYFTISPNQKEIQLGECSEDAVEDCIDFMYTNDISVTLENVEAVYNVSLTFQLDGVSKECSNCIAFNLTVKNCLIVRRLAEMFKTDFSKRYGFAGFAAKADQFIVEHFQEVIETEAFAKTPTAELIRLLKHEHPPYVISNALILWVSHDSEIRSNELKNVIKSLNLSKFSCHDLVFLTNIKKILASPGVKELLGYEILQRSNGTITTENWADLRELAVKMSLRNLEDRVNKFVLEKFATVAGAEAFDKIDKFSLLYFLKIIPLTKASECFTWAVLLKWTKFHGEREKCFSEIIKNINLSRFSIEFIKNVIKNEPLINQDNDCLRMVIEALCTKT